MTDSLPPLLTGQCAVRQREVDNAVLVQTLCGRQLTATIYEQLRRYVLGELTREQAFASFYSRR
ncbi:hypothetical protein HHL22_17995 [Hymenobacter sp. RP-2-7]|uniref:Antitoxin VbhA domain-containing protein n=1 Tax=Hymenobacter polaris TaxID=2682546 RepID=A0A7Y0AGV4_9BACT|nr:hypothetical protein [Hymenobacter polaris]NML67102.1 hypothetical protein [Hymenobacter polaris]